MFFWFSKVLRIFTDPLVWILAAWGFLAWRRGGPWARGLWLVAYLLSTPLVSGTMLNRLEHLNEASVLRKDYDYLVVLSGMLDLSKPGPHLAFNSAADRLTTALDLYKAGRGKKIALIGGDGSLQPSGSSEARLLADWLVTQGIPPEDLLVGPNSRNTYQNGVEALELTALSKQPRLLLITSAFHMHRAQAVFRALGSRPDIYPTDYQGPSGGLRWSDGLPSLGALSHLSLVVTETLGIMAYRLTGRAQ